MRTLGIIALCVVLLIGGAVVWAQISYPTYFYRYRITLEVEVDGAIKTGTSVIEVRRRWDPVPGRPISHYSSAVSGEAVFVDIGQAGNLFMLLTDEPNKSPDVLAAKVFHFDATDATDPVEQSRRAHQLMAAHANAKLRAEQLPMLVTFSDLNDANSARIVRPTEFERSFGSAVHLVGAWITMTDEPATKGIEKKLLWWDQPQTWLKPIGNGVYADTRPTGALRINKEQFKKGS